MASRFYRYFKQTKVSSPGTRPSPGTGGEKSEKAVSEKTAAWPSAGPVGPMPFNKTTRWPVVKNTAKKEGIC